MVLSTIAALWEWPFIMIGDAGGKLKAGRYVDYPGYACSATAPRQTSTLLS